MSISSAVTQDEYVGNGVTTNYPFTFEFTDVNTIKPTVDDAIVGFSFDNVITPTTIIFDVPPALDAVVFIKRVTPRIQETELNENQDFSDRAEAIEDQFDRVVSMIQEIEQGTTEVTPASSNPSIYDVWEPSTAYIANEMLRDGPTGRFYLVEEDYTSNVFDIETDITAGKLELFNQGAQGPKGAKGDQGIQGIQGIAGTNGTNGAQGNDGIFSEIAEVGEAEAGVNNTKGMTPLRTKQAITEQIPSFLTGINSAISALQSTVSTQNAEIIMLKAALSTTLGRYTGRQELLLNQVTPLAISADVGTPLLFNTNGTEFVHLQFYIRRGATVATNFEAVAQFVNGSWLIGRKDTVLLDETLEIDGVTLSIETTGVEGQVFYTSETVGGVFDQDEHYISWIGQEIRQGNLL